MGRVASHAARKHLVWATRARSLTRDIHPPTRPIPRHHKHMPTARRCVPLLHPPPPLPQLPPPSANVTGSGFSPWIGYDGFTTLPRISRQLTHTLTSCRSRSFQVVQAPLGRAVWCRIGPWCVMPDRGVPPLVSSRLVSRQLPSRLVSSRHNARLVSSRPLSIHLPSSFSSGSGQDSGPPGKLQIPTGRSCRTVARVATAFVYFSPLEQLCPSMPHLHRHCWALPRAKPHTDRRGGNLGCSGHRTSHWPIGGRQRRCWRHCHRRCLNCMERPPCGSPDSGSDDTGALWKACAELL